MILSDNPTTQNRLLPLLLLALFSASVVGVMIGAFNQFWTFAAILAATLGLLLLLRWPSWPIVVGYPIVSLIWSYDLPIVHGQPERLIALLGLFSALLLILKREKILLPPVSVLLSRCSSSWDKSWLLC